MDIQKLIHYPIIMTLLNLEIGLPSFSMPMTLICLSPLQITMIHLEILNHVFPMSELGCLQIFFALMTDKTEFVIFCWKLWPCLQWHTKYSFWWCVDFCPVSGKEPCSQPWFLSLCELSLMLARFIVLPCFIFAVLLLYVWGVNKSIYYCLTQTSIHRECTQMSNQI